MRMNSCKRMNSQISAIRRLFSSQDPYKILGISRNASSSEIKKAYFDLARKYHPDTNKEKSASEKFIEIQNAYEVSLSALSSS